jgi:hypothetical protein
VRSPKRKPGRAVAAALVLTLTACGSARPTSAPAGRPLGGAFLATPIPALKTLEAGFATAVEPVADLDLAQVSAQAAVFSVDPSVADNYTLPAPDWWKGVCNAGSSRGAKPLGASYRGVLACGPQPGKSDGRLVRFFPGAWGEYEWQCTELVYRFMYLAYGVRPYNGNGDQVVDHYRPEYGGNLVKVTNGSGSLPSPGDILSYLSVHTSIVTAVDVDLTGTGTITVLEQNAPNDGRATLSVTNGRIAGIKNWLHRIPG